LTKMTTLLAEKVKSRLSSGALVWICGLILPATAILFEAVTAFCADFTRLGLCTIALPVTASLQFFGGLPMRLAAARIASWMLQVAGTAVAPEGTGLRWPVD
jgi:hypothetical protein